MNSSCFPLQIDKNNVIVASVLRDLNKYVFRLSMWERTGSTLDFRRLSKVILKNIYLFIYLFKT